MCLAAASLAVVLWLVSAGRMLHATARSYRYLRRWRRQGRPDRIPQASTPAWVIESDVPFLALAGIVRPRLIATRGLLRTLSSRPTFSSVAARRSAPHIARQLEAPYHALRPGNPAVCSRIRPARASLGEICRTRRRRPRRLGDPRPRPAARRGSGARGSASHSQSASCAPLLADASELHARVQRLLHPAPAAGPARWRLQLIASAALALRDCRAFPASDPSPRRIGCSKSDPLTQMPAALVTGASRGVGRGVAIALADAGFQVFATGPRYRSAGLPPAVVRIRCDHLRMTHTAAAFERVAARSRRSRHSGQLGLGRLRAHGREMASSTWPLPFWEQPLIAGPACWMPASARPSSLPRMRPA